MSSQKTTVCRVAFLGSKAFGLGIAKSLYAVSPELDWTILHPADQTDQRSVLQEFVDFAAANGIPFHVVASAKETREILHNLRPDVGFACGWYWLFDKATLDLPLLGIWGIHNSLLPKYRGAAPLVWSIINGDEWVGSSLFRMSEGVDDGPILYQARARLELEHQISDVLEEIERQFIEALPEKWSELVMGQATPTQQDEAEATYCGRRNEGDGIIDWTADATTVHNFIRAQAPPYPCAFSYLSGRKVKMLRSRPYVGTFYGTPGQVLSRRPGSVLVSCGGATAIELIAVEIEGQARNPSEIAKSLDDRFSRDHD
jgi:methionyl-tRNA formyltransferase